MERCHQFWQRGKFTKIICVIRDACLNWYITGRARPFDIDLRHRNNKLRHSARPLHEPPESRPRIALLVEASRAYGRELLRGVSYFARTQVDWSLLHQEMTLDSAMPDWMRQSRIDGVIARVDAHNIESLRELRRQLSTSAATENLPAFPKLKRITGASPN